MNAHLEIIWLLSFISSFIFALVISMTVFKLQMKAVERWARPFAWMFWALTGMYFIRIVGWVFTNSNHFPVADETIIKPSVEFGVLACSAASNFFLLRVANKLWSEENTNLSKRFKLHHKLSEISWFIIAGIFLLSSLLASLEKSIPLLRLPDAIISAGCLIYAGFAFYRSISSRRSNFNFLRHINNSNFGNSTKFHLSSLITNSAWFFCSSYGVLHIFYGLTPLVFPPDIVAIYDSYVIAIALILKLGIFIPAYSFLLTVVNSHKKIRSLLEEVVNGRKEFLESDGLVRAIKESLQVTQVDLFIKLPGIEDNQVAVYSYPPIDEDPFKRPKIYSLNESKSQIFLNVVKWEKEYRFQVRGYANNIPHSISDELKENSSVIVTPIKYHGAIIGCLYLELETGKLKESDIQQTREISYLISPAVQAYREIAALDRLSFKLSSLQLEQSELGSQKAIEKITKILYDIINPQAIGLLSEIGFEKSQAILPTDWKYYEQIKSRLENTNHSQEIHQTENETVWFTKDLITLSLGIDDKNKRKFGKLILATEAKRGTSPYLSTLATYYLYRQVISNLTTDALFDFARDYFSEILKELGVDLNEIKSDSVNDWYDCIKQYALKAGLIWVVATRPDVEKRMGSANAVNLVDSLNILPKIPDKTGFYQQEQKIFFHKFDESKSNAYSIIPIYLKDSKQTIWLGISNPHFEYELDYLSPWRVFLERFAEIADAALFRINASIYKKGTQEIQRWAKVAFAHPALIHQIINQVRSFTLPLEMLELAVQKHELSGNENQIRSIKSLRPSASKLLNLTSYFEDIDKSNQINFPLIESINHALGSLKISLDDYNISVKIEVDPNLKIGVPFPTTTLAILALITNAKDALKDLNRNSGQIILTAQDQNSEILLKITDNGPGINKDIAEKLFLSEVQSNKSYGKGKGLYMSNFLLRTDDAHIELTKSCNPTEFTIYFPKIQKETH